jgi:hypothetical protein
MVCKSLLLLGLGLAILWWFGLSRNPSATVLWFDAVGAVLSFGSAGLIGDADESSSLTVVPALFGLGFSAVAVASGARGQPVWATGMNFLFALAYLGVAIAAGVGARRRLHAHARR